MKNLTTILCLTFATFLASAVVSWSFEFQKSLDTIKSDTFATALKELKRLAKGGDPQAQNNLGVMYRGGLGVPKDDQTAFTWFRLAAERGNAPAQANLGFMYANGMGVLQDWVYAHMWSNIAVSSGFVGAVENIHIFSKKMLPPQLEKAKELAQECIRKKYKAC